MTDLQIFMNAPRDASTEELKVYLDEACGGEPALRARVESLFQADQAAANGFMGQPAVELDEAEPSAVIGRYKLLQEIGQGGFGVVFMADQEEPVKRRVALKIIKVGMDTRQVVARFEAERQALAMMDHPNIARVLDGGETEEGRPYFVMELVKGIPITEFCHQEKLSIAARLKLFNQVCRAVQHAHSKGIIHRDLKPSNVLVTVKDGEPVPKVIDFGIAKAIDQRLTEKTLFTRYEQMIGTPTYMSPEQAALSGVDLDTRSDIYSLGVLLYELLTGTTPFDAKALHSAAFDEMRRIIREDDPPKPSTKLSATMAAADSSRRHQMKDIIISLRGDLDWIVMKCLEKDRARRYETANGVSLDVERYLTNEPVLACPPTALYRFKKMAKRHKLAFGGATAVLGGLLLGLVFSLWGWTEANHARQVADEQRAMADASKRDADEQRRQAVEKARQLARQVYVMELFEADQAIGANNLVRARTVLGDISEDVRGWEWTFLKERMDAALSEEIPSGEQPCFTSDGSSIVGLGRESDGKSVVVREISTLRPMAVFPHTMDLMSLALSPQDRWLAAGDVDGNLIMWNFKTHEKLWEKPESPRKGFVGVAQSDDGSRIGLAFSPDGQWIASANFTNTISVFEVLSGKKLFSVQLDSLIRKVMFSPDGRWIAAGSQPPVLVDTQTRDIVSFPKGEMVPTFSRDGRQIATGNPSSRTITLWTWDGKELVRQKSWKGAGSSRFFDLCYLPDGVHLASAQGKHVMVWNTQTQAMVAYVEPDFADWLSVNPKGDLLAICGAKIRLDKGPGLYLWQFGGAGKRMTLNPMKEAIQLAEFSPDGTRIAMGSHRGQQGMSALETPGPVWIADLQSGDIVTTIDQSCRGFAWLPDSRWIIVTRDGTQSHEMYDTVTGALIRGFAAGSAVGRPFIGRSGDRVMSLAATGSGRTMLRIWDIETAEIQEEIDMGFIQDPGAVRRTMGGYWNGKVGPTGRHVAVSGGINGVSLWETGNQGRLNPLVIKGSTEDGVGFTADGTGFYISGQGLFGLYHVDSGLSLANFSGPAGGVAVSPDNKHVVSCGRGVVVWDIETELPAITLSDAGDTEYISVDWSPDKTRIAAGRADGSVHIWRLPISTP